MKVKHISSPVAGLSKEEFKSYWRIYAKYFKDSSRKIRLLLFYNSRDGLECVICGTWGEALHFTKGRLLVYDSIYILPREYKP